ILVAIKMSDPQQARIAVEPAGTTRLCLVARREATRAFRDLQHAHMRWNETGSRKRLSLLAGAERHGCSGRETAPPLATAPRMARCTAGVILQQDRHPRRESGKIGDVAGKI